MNIRDMRSKEGGREEEEEEEEGLGFKFHVVTW